ncbi:hypothetical protein vseg_017333 [Gypsophila vaccaria]
MSSDESLHGRCTQILLLISVPTYLSGRYLLQAPYGRHSRGGWGPTLPSWLSWLLMESPSVFSTLAVFPHGRHSSSPRSLSLLSLFLLHYLHRTFLFPLLHHYHSPRSHSRFPVAVSLLAFSFNSLNSYVQSRSISHFHNHDLDPWFWPRFLLGAAVFVVGMIINISSDSVLLGLKRRGEGYKVPTGGLFEWVSCANYFGEIVEWLGWAIMTWDWAGFGFFVYTCSYLMPRARATHLWYLDKFREEYPQSRKAVIPFLY